jgi:hypothetical protein
MLTAQVLTNAFGSIHDAVHRAVDGLTAEQLTFRPDDEANSIAWLVWHLTRVQDDHVADVATHGQVWLEGGWVERFGLPLAPSDTGYGAGSDEVAAVAVSSGELLTGYHDEVYRNSVDFVAKLHDADLDRVVDTRFDPPVTLGVRLGSVIADDLQHAGQAAYVRGIVLRR